MTLPRGPELSLPIQHKAELIQLCLLVWVENDPRRTVNLEIQIHRLTLGDLEAIENLPFDDPYRICQWTPEALAVFRDNPFRQRQNELVQLVGAVDGTAAGSLKFLPGELTVNGEPHTVVWCSGLYVVPQHRNSLLGISLLKEARDSFEVIGGSAVSDLAFPIFKRLGWLDFPLTRYIMPCTCKPIVDQLCGADGVTPFVRPLVDLVLFLHRCLLQARAAVFCRNFRSAACSLVPDSLDRSLSTLNQVLGCHRSSRWLNWNLHHSLNPSSRLTKNLYLVRDRTDRIVAYYITRVKHRKKDPNRKIGDLLVGSVLDWGIFDASAVKKKPLYLDAANRLSAQGVDVVEICDTASYASMPIGFKRVGQHRFVLLSNVEDPKFTNDQAPIWELRQIDGDSGLS